MTLVSTPVLGWMRRAGQRLTAAVLVTVLGLLAGTPSRAAADDPVVGPAVDRLITTSIATTTEGNTLVFVLSIDPPLTTGTASVEWTTAVDGATTALPGLDFQSASGTAVFPPFSSSTTVTINSIEDNIHEPQETFLVLLSTPIGALLGNGGAYGYINNDDPLPTISINDVTEIEGSWVTISLSLSNPSSVVVRTDVSVVEGTATLGIGGDFWLNTPFPYQVSFAPGETIWTSSNQIQASGDLLDENAETFSLVLSNPIAGIIGDGTAIVTIADDDPPPVLTIPDASVSEFNGVNFLFFNVNLSAASGKMVQFTFQTANGTATAPSDYVTVNPTVVTVNPGQLGASLSVIIAGDTVPEPTEHFFVTLSAPVNATIGDGSATMTILDNDTPAAPEINVTPGSLNFGSVSVGATSATQQVTVQNTGTAALAVGTLALSGVNAGDFAKSADTCSGQSVAPAGQCTFSMAFSPTAPGARVGRVSIPSDDADEPLVNVGFNGTGVGAPEINVTPGSLSFGSVVIGGTSATQQVTVQNTGTAALTVGTLTLAGTHFGDFAKSADTCSGQSVAPAGQCTLSVAFSPTAVGARTATLVVPSSDADENPVNTALSGAGAAPVIGGKNLGISTGSIHLGWDGGNQQTAYTLLRYNTSTAVADLIALAGNATSYSDAGAVNGVVYCYVLAALNGPTFLGLSDLLCGMAGQQAGAVPVSGFSLVLGQTATATMKWTNPGADSMLLQRIPLDGTPITSVPVAPEAETATELVTAAGTCFQLVAFQGAGFGTSDVLCGVPGVSTLSGQSAQAALLAAVARVAGVIAGGGLPRP